MSIIYSLHIGLLFKMSYVKYMENNMEKYKNIGDIIVVISLVVLFIVGIPLFLSKASVESGQDYFEGRILENTGDSIIVKVGEEYEELLDSIRRKYKNL